MNRDKRSNIRDIFPEPDKKKNSVEIITQRILDKQTLVK